MLSKRNFDIVSIDPLVGDSACHIRAVYQAYLASKSSLTDLEVEYLNFAEFLTTVKQVERDAFEIIIEEKIDSDKVKTKAISQAEMAKRKKLVADMAIKFFEESCEKLQQVEIKNLGKRIMKASKVDFPVLSLYLSAKMMLYACSVNKIPLFVYLKRLTGEENQYKLDSSNVYSYEYSEDVSAFVPAVLAEDKSGVAIEMISCRVSGTETMDDLVMQLTQQDVATLIMIMAAGHDQYPKLVKTEDKLRESDADLKDLPVTNDFKVDLRVASASEYNQLCRVAFKYGMFGENARYAQVEKATKSQMRTSTSIVYIDHSYCATLKKVNEKNQALQKKCEGLIVAREISGSLKR